MNYHVRDDDQPFGGLNNHCDPPSTNNYLDHIDIWSQKSNDFGQNKTTSDYHTSLVPKPTHGRKIQCAEAPKLLARP